jgi:hypothetical protein
LLSIYSKNPDVQAAMSAWGTDQEKKGSVGYNKLLEAGALARIYNNCFSSSKELPSEYKKFMDFKEKATEEQPAKE